MHLVLTDVLTCPRCGPRFGLILLADRVIERRVLEGALGCANCRERYPIRGGFADLRPPPAPSLSEVVAPVAEGGEAAVRLGALLGLREGKGFWLLAGEGTRHAPAVAALVEGVEVVATDAALAGWPEEAGVSRIAAGGELPFHDRSLPGVALTGGAADTLLEEGARVLGPLGRLVLTGAPADAERRLGAVGLGVLAREGETVVAGRGGGGR